MEYSNQENQEKIAVQAERDINIFNMRASAQKIGLSSNEDFPKMSRYALGAKNIRKELKSIFSPYSGIKFKVTSKGYSMGSSIDIKWEDGPNTESVAAITSKYQYGSFDSMTDYYDYSADQRFTNEFGGAKFVMESRRISKRLIDICSQIICKSLNVECVGPETIGLYGDSDTEPVARIVERILRRQSLASNFTPTRFVFAGNVNRFE